MPYYPELSCLNRGDAPDNALLLSVLLFWYARSGRHRFNARRHAQMLARDLRLGLPRITAALESLSALGVLDRRPAGPAARGPLPAARRDEYYSVNFRALSRALQERGLNVPLRVLRLAADDSRELLTYISPAGLPLLTGLKGTLKGEPYDRTALAAARLLCGLCAAPELEEFSRAALAPGWRLLAQPPVTPEELSARWRRAGERSIDLDLSEGAIFLPDGACFGARRHHIRQSGRCREAGVLAAAVYLAAAALSDEVEFYSELEAGLITEALGLLYRLTGLKGRIGPAYFDYLGLSGSLREELAGRFAAELARLAGGL